MPVRVVAIVTHPKGLDQRVLFACAEDR